MRVFLDANILFSAARSRGAIARLLAELDTRGAQCVISDYVYTEARVNLARKAPSGLDALEAMAKNMVLAADVSPLHDNSFTDWLPQKDRPVLTAAIRSSCDILLTGDRRDFGARFGQVVEGVHILSPLLLAQYLQSGAGDRGNL